MKACTPTGPVLAADVGGTHVRFALVGIGARESLIAGSTRHYLADDFSGFSDAVRRYLDETGARPSSAVIATAGLRVGDEVRLTNRAWAISRARIEAEFGLARAVLINDFAAMALCVSLLKPTDLRALGAPAAKSVDGAQAQTFAIIGPGTGLGVGALLSRDRRQFALETEGGHTTFAAGNDEEIEILRRLIARFGRVSNERLLSGSGLVNLYQVLCDMHGTHARLSKPEGITRQADSDADCRRAVERFCEILGAVAGDLVLVFGAWDGLYLSGGMVPPLERWLAAGGFRRRFEDKGRLSAAMSRVPASLVLQADAGLLGAAAFALAESGLRARRSIRAEQ